MICLHCMRDTDYTACTHCGRSILLNNAFVVEQVIGRGGRGTTYSAIRAHDRHKVAIKEYPIRHFDDLKDWELARREASVLAQLDHPAIPNYHEHFEAGEGRSKAFFIVQELVDGVTLGTEMKTTRYDEKAVMNILEELLGVLNYLHSRSPPVIHRDIKPDNIMRRNADGRLVLIDFGSVKDALDGPGGGSTVTGTFGFMAPEQFSGDACPASDLYGLGATAVTLLSRRAPSECLDGGLLVWEPHVSLSIKGVHLLRRLLAPKIEDCFNHARQVLNAIRSPRPGEPTAAPLARREVRESRSRISPHRPKAGGRIARAAIEARPELNSKRLALLMGVFGIPMTLRVTEVYGVGGLAAGGAMIAIWALLIPLWRHRRPLASLVFAAAVGAVGWGVTGWLFSCYQDMPPDLTALSILPSELLGMLLGGFGRGDQARRADWFFRWISNPLLMIVLMAPVPLLLFVVDLTPQSTSSLVGVGCGAGLGALLGFYLIWVSSMKVE